MTATPAKVAIERPSQIGGRRIGVLVADATRMGCQLLENALRRSRRFSVIASAVNRSEIMDSLAQGDVDVALISENLQDGPFTGFQVVREVHAAYPRTRVVVLLNSAQHELVVDAFRGGAKGVFCRAEPFGALCKCIQAVHSGQVWANSNDLQAILQALVNAAPLRKVNAQGLSLLAKREKDVVRLLADGLTNREIAIQLGLSEHTVSNYLFRIYNKLGISTRVELVLYVLSQEQNQIPG